MIPVLNTCYGAAAVRSLAPVLVALVFLAGCSDGAPDSRPTIVASSYPLAWAAERVARRRLPGGEPHARRGGAARHRADAEGRRDDPGRHIVVYLVRRLPAGSRGGGRPNARVRRSTLAAPTSTLTSGSIRSASRVSSSSSARALGRPEAARRVRAQLRDVDDRYEAGLATCARSTFVTDHAAFGHLARRYGLSQLSLVGVSPEAEPAPRAVERLIDEVKAVGAPVVFAEPLVSDRLARTVANGAGVERLRSRSDRGAARRAARRRVTTTSR